MNGKRPRPDAATLNDDAPRPVVYPTYSHAGYSHFPPANSIPPPQLYSPSAGVLEPERPYYLNPVNDPPSQSMQMQQSPSQGATNSNAQNGNSWEYDYSNQEYADYTNIHHHWNSPQPNGNMPSNPDSARSEAELRKRLREARGGGSGMGLSAGAMPFEGVKIEGEGGVMANKKVKMNPSTLSDNSRATSLPSALPPTTAITNTATRNGPSSSRSTSSKSIRENLQLVSKKINELPVEGIETILDLLSIIIEDVQQLENQIPPQATTQATTQTQVAPISDQILGPHKAGKGIKVGESLEKISSTLGTGFDELKVSLDKILKIVSSSSSAGEKRDSEPARVKNGAERSNTIDMTIDDDEDSQTSKSNARPLSTTFGSGSGANGIKSTQGGAGGGGRGVGSVKGTKNMSPDSPLPTGPASNITTYRKPVVAPRHPRAGGGGGGVQSGGRTEDTKPLSTLSTRSSSSSLAVATLLQPSLNHSTNSSRAPILTTVKKYPPSSSTRPHSPPPHLSTVSTRPLSPPPPTKPSTRPNAPTQASLFRPPAAYFSHTTRYAPRPLSSTVGPSTNGRRPVSPPPPPAMSTSIGGPSRRNSKDFSPPLPTGRLSASLGSRSGERERERDGVRGREVRSPIRELPIEGYEDLRYSLYDQEQYQVRERERSPIRNLTSSVALHRERENGYDYRSAGGGGRERERDQWEREREMDRERDLRDLRDREREASLRERERGYGGPNGGAGGANGNAGGSGGKGARGVERGFLGQRGGGGQYRVV